MKRFRFVLLMMGLLTVVSTTAFAVDVKLSGEFYSAGLYLNKTSLENDIGPSTAFYYQRLRVRTDFVVEPGLTLTTRFDALERVWGATRSTPGTSTATDSSGTMAENENIAIDWAYINYQSPIGVFNVGIMNKGATGTAFGNNLAPAARIKYAYTSGPFFIEAAISKLKDNSYTASNAASYSDGDSDEYAIEGIYTWETGKAGMQITYARDASKRSSDNYEKVYWQLTPYMIAKFGPVKVETEVNYVTGKNKEYDNNTPDVKLNNLSAYVDAMIPFGMFYAGVTFAYVSGDDPSTTDKAEGGTLTGGRDWQPCLIMWNYERTNWAGSLTGYDSSAQDTRMSNGFLYQGRFGVKPTDKLDVVASLTYAKADQTPTDYISDTYGYEVDVKATYKITNNLSYMLGAAYLASGDYYKGKNAANDVQNDYLVINKLILTF